MQSACCWHGEVRKGEVGWIEECRRRKEGGRERSGEMRERHSGVIWL